MTPARERRTVPEAVFFDFDGVLADTENVQIAAWEATFHEMGAAVEEIDCSRACEEDDRDFLRSVFESWGVFDGDIAGWTARKQARSIAMIADAPQLCPGAAEAVLALSGKARLAVVSSGWRENILVCLGAAGLLDRFEQIIAKEDVARPKPAPDPYLRAVELLAIPPDRVLALEDSPGGLASAESAGVPAIAVGHRRAAGKWCAKVPFIKSLNDLPGLFELPAPNAGRPTPPASAESA